MNSYDLQSECGWTDVDGTRCGLTNAHVIHSFTVPPPEEFFEDEDEGSTERSNMAEVTPKKEGKTISLTFSTEAELAIFKKLESLAAEDERSISSFTKRHLKSILKLD